jgi:protease-4
MDSDIPPQAPIEPTLATAADEQSLPPGLPPRRKRGWLLPFLILGLCGSLMANFLLFGAARLSRFGSIDSEHAVRETHFSHQQGARDKVAIISVTGTILGGRGFVKNQIDQVRRDPNVKAVVLRVNSPGGPITGSDYIYHHLSELVAQSEIPLVVSMGSLAASGGYYVSMACGETPDVIFAEPTTWTGSIGVVIPHYDLSKLAGDWGIVDDSIVSHRLKTMGGLTKTMTGEELAIFQELVDESFDRFKGIIKQGRPKFAEDPEALDKLATGQIYTADQALESGLIDKIGFIEEAIRRAIELAKLDKNKVDVVEYGQPLGLASILMGKQTQNGPTGLSDLSTILDMAAPRAYYLCTWLPPLAANTKP